MGIQYLYDSFLHIVSKNRVDLRPGYIDWIPSRAGYDKGESRMINDIYSGQLYVSTGMRSASLFKT